jgi:Tfp pilus assembly protein PilO
MKTQDVSVMLDDLAAIRAKVARLQQKAQEQKDKILGPLKKRLDKVDEELAQRSKQLLEDAETLDSEVHALVSEFAETVRGEALMAVYVKPRPNWDNSKLEGFALEHPVLLQARTYGKPTVQIREIKETK